MAAIFKREFTSFFSSAIAYVVLSVYFVFSSAFMFWYCLTYNTANLSPIFTSMLIITAIVIPVATMKLFSEEKRQKTDQALLTAPVSIFQIVFGKYLAALLLFVCCLAIYFVYAIVIACFVTPAWTMILCNFIGSFLIGAALIAVGMFISSLTDSQVVAAVVSMAAGLVLVSFVDMLANIIPVEVISGVITSISFSLHYQDFAAGTFNIPDVVFFLSIIAVFLFLTDRALERKRWS